LLRLPLPALVVSSTPTLGTEELVDDDDDDDLPLLLLLGKLEDDDAANCNDVSRGKIDE
jgi:hypothetical protein